MAFSDIATGASQTFVLGPNDTLRVVGNGGAASVTVTPAGGSAAVTTLGPSPFRQSFGNYGAPVTVVVAAVTGPVSVEGMQVSKAFYDWYADVKTSVVGVANTSEQILKQWRIPAGLLTGVNYAVIRALFGKSGTTENSTLRVRIGTTGTTSDVVIGAAASITAANQSYSMELPVIALTATSLRRFSSTVYGGFGSTNSTATFPNDTTIPDCNVNSLWISLTAQQATGAEFTTLGPVVMTICP